MSPARESAALPVAASSLLRRRYLSVAQAADLLGVDPRTVRQRIAAGQLPAWQGVAKGRWLIPTAYLRKLAAVTELAKIERDAAESGRELDEMTRQVTVQSRISRIVRRTG